jgi:hypothetical protein
MMLRLQEKLEGLDIHPFSLLYDQKGFDGDQCRTNGGKPHPV